MNNFIEKINKYKQKKGVPRFFEVKDLLEKKGGVSFIKQNRNAVIYVCYNLCEVTYKFIGNQLGISFITCNKAYKRIEKKILEKDNESLNQVKSILNILIK